jgi:hypothetical protein
VNREGKRVERLRTFNVNSRTSTHARPLPPPTRPLTALSPTPTLSLRPYLVTMALASRVACMMSEDAPDVTLSAPKMSSSATRPPMHTSNRASICYGAQEG